MSKDKEQNRPPYRGRRITIPMDDELVDKGVKKAGSRSKFIAILRVFGFLWANDEIPDPPSDLIEKETRRSPRRKK